MITEFCDNLVDWIGERLSVVFVGFVLFIVGVLALAIYVEFTKAQSPTIALRKTEWECTGTRQESTTTYVQSGKVMVPITTYHDVCVEYTKR